jgi:transmembrane sensor
MIEKSPQIITKMVSGKKITMIAKKLANHCSAEESSELEHWLDLNRRNRNLYFQYQLVWKYTGITPQPYSFDNEAAWQSLQNRVRNFEKQEKIFRVGSKPSIRLAPVLVRIAAVLVLALAGWYIFKPEVVYEPQLISIAANEVRTESVMLPDGTNITLNKGSKLNYNKNFNLHHRKVDFEGEAFFDVSPDDANPFIISTSNLIIKVIGTSFNLIALPDQENVELYLKTGKVQVNSINQEGETLEQLLANPGEKVVYDKNSGLLIREKIKDQNYLAWKTGILEFNNAPLDEVLEALGKTYDFNFIVEHNCTDFLLTARFENETPESIFQTLELVFNLDILQQNDHILIR